MNCRFTDWSVIAQDVTHYSLGIQQNFQDCEFHGGHLFNTSTAVNLTNCLLDRVDTDLEPQDSNLPVVINNLFRGGTFNFQPAVTNSIVKNNLFDTTSIPDYFQTNGSTYDGGYNAYLTNCDRIYPTFTNDVILTNALAYQPGPLGIYYQPTNSWLINAGSTYANLLGLYHYTTTTNQVPETNSLVDIGLHYIATDANGVPLDTDGDGIPDYLEDANGNGLVDSGETDWQNPNDLGLKVVITRPKSNSVIP
jgi:hypothetical protein